jgi:ABC-type antimicrobial peptide transport system permease subunit
VSGQLGALTRLLYGSAIAVTLVSVPLLGLLAAMVTHERRREVSILRALGARRSFVAGLLLAESFALAIVGGVLGIGGAMAILVLFQDLISQTLRSRSFPLAPDHPRPGDALSPPIDAAVSSLHPIYRSPVQSRRDYPE